MYINYRSVSVIIPTWNRANIVVKAIKSVLNQTLPPLEILVCDDGSIDDTFEIVKSIKNKRIKWIAGAHSGLPAVPRNRGIKESRGEWLTFLDSDDEWLPKKLEKQLALAKRLDCLAVCCNAYSVDAEGKRKKYLAYSKETIDFFDLLKANHVICSTAVIHRSLISKCLGFPENKNLKAIED